jgi:hypothetical protein
VFVRPDVPASDQLLSHAHLQVPIAFGAEGMDFLTRPAVATADATDAGFILSLRPHLLNRVLLL